MRTILIATLLGLAACGGADPEAACENYIASVDGCLAELGDDSMTSPVTDGFCDGYTGLKGDEAATQETYLNCLADAWDAADCSTVEGFGEAGTAAMDCTATAAE